MSQVNSTSKRERERQQSIATYRKNSTTIAPDHRRRYRQNNSEKMKEIRRLYSSRSRQYNRAMYLEEKTKALNAYGAVCRCCGEANQCFLTIDHINNDGAKHRRQGTGAGRAIYRWLAQNDFPEGFQVLCYNCNSAKQHDIAGHRAAHPRAHLIDGGDAAMPLKKSVEIERSSKQKALFSIETVNDDGKIQGSRA